MATVPKQRRTREIEYPTGDGKPVAETGLHVRELLRAYQLLDDHFAGQPNVFVGANMFLYYVKGNRRKPISPDVMVTMGIPKEPLRDCYLVWEEGKAPDFALEITSKSTRGEDEKKKLVLYRDVLKVGEYFLFDPRAEYLDPPLQGFRLQGGDYIPIEPIAGRLPSEVLGLHLERDGEHLHFFDPATGEHLLSPLEGREAAARRAALERQRADEARQSAEKDRQRAEDAAQSAALERQRADEARQSSEKDRQRADDAAQSAALERQRADEARQSAEKERQRAEDAGQSAALERQRADEARQRADEARQSAEAAVAAQRKLAEENERLRREIEAMRRG